SPRSRVTGWCVNSRSKRAPTRSMTSPGRLRPSSPPQSARSRRSRLWMRQSWKNAPASAPARRRRRSQRSSTASSPPQPRAEPHAFLDFELTDEQRLISDTARDFADKEIAPRVRDNDRAARFDRELASELGEIGYLGAPVAEEYGGRGLD